MIMPSKPYYLMYDTEIYKGILITYFTFIELHLLTKTDSLPLLNEFFNITLQGFHELFLFLWP